VVPEGFALGEPSPPSASPLHQERSARESAHSRGADANRDGYVLIRWLLAQCEVGSFQGVRIPRSPGFSRRA
jgi:hypothetical protein